MTTINAGGRELALLFNIAAMDEMEERLGTPIDLSNINTSLVQKLGDRHALVAAAAIMARQGEEAVGREADFDEDWLKANLKPGALVRLQANVVKALAEGLGMETGEPGENEDVDVVLEEIKKKRPKAASQ